MTPAVAMDNVWSYIGPAGYTASSGTVQVVNPVSGLADGASYDVSGAKPSSIAPRRLTFYKQAWLDFAGRLKPGIKPPSFLCTGRSDDGNYLTPIAVESGGTDQDFAAGDIVAVVFDANTINEMAEAVASAGGVGSLVAANNLSDLASVPTAKTNLGLGNVDNTSDVNKPVSTATAAALAAKASLAANAFTGTQTVTLTGHASSKGVVVTPDPSQTANLIDCGAFFVRADGGHVVQKDWDQLASDAPMLLASKTHPNRKFYAGYVDSSNCSVWGSIDADASVFTPIYVYCSYISVSNNVQAQDGLYVATQAASTQPCLQVLNHSQQGTGNDLSLPGLTVHNYSDGPGGIFDNVGSSPALRLRNAHNSTARADKPSNYVGTGNFLVCSTIDSVTFTTWTDRVVIDPNGCLTLSSDWADGLIADAPLKLAGLTHPNRMLYMGYQDAGNSAIISAIDTGGGVNTPIHVYASHLFLGNSLTSDVWCSGPIGVNGATPPAKAPAPATLADVIAILRGVGFCS